jgi:hypothetical protein
MIKEPNVGAYVNRTVQPAETNVHEDTNSLTLLDFWPLPPPFSIGTFLRILKDLLQ